MCKYMLHRLGLVSRTSPSREAVSREGLAHETRLMHVCRYHIPVHGNIQLVRNSQSANYVVATGSSLHLCHDVL